MARLPSAVSINHHLQCYECYSFKETCSRKDSYIYKRGITLYTIHITLYTKRWQILTDAVYNAVIVALNMFEEIHNIINNRIFTLHVFVPASDLGNLLVLEYWKSVLGTYFMAGVSSQ